MAFASCTKEKYGVIFHENMQLQDVIDTWNSKVSQQVKSDNPEIDALMQAGQVTSLAQEAVHVVTVTAVGVYDDVQELDEIATSAITGNVTLPAALIASVGAQVLDLAQVPIIDAAKDEILNTLDC